MQPTSGSRSAVYFGIDRLFSLSWFGEASHSDSNRTAHPILNVFRGTIERQQIELRRQFMAALSGKGYSLAEALRLWQEHVQQATKVVTKSFNSLYLKDGVVELDPDAMEKAYLSGVSGLRYLETVCESQKHSPPQLDLLLGDTRVYLRRQLNPEPDGRIHVKIGKTDRSESRNASYKNHSGGKVVLVWERFATNGLNEDSLRSALKNASSIGVEQQSRDWFFLPSSVFEQINTALKAEKFTFQMTRKESRTLRFNIPTFIRFRIGTVFSRITNPESATSSTSFASPTSKTAWASPVS